MLNWNNKIDNLLYAVSYKDEREYSCEDSGCDEEGICRCCRIVGVEFCDDLDSVNKFFELIYEGGLGVEKALDHWFVRKHFKDIRFDYEVGGDYYGDELSKIVISDDGDFFNKASTFNQMSNSEKVQFLLKKEYGSVLPKIKNVKDWKLEAVFVSDVVNSGNTNFHPPKITEYETDFSYIARNSVVSFQEKTLQYAPLTIKVNGKYQVIDGRHRTHALTKEYPYETTTEIRDKNGRKKYKISKEVFIPMYMWVICPVEENVK